MRLFSPISAGIHLSTALCLSISGLAKEIDFAQDLKPVLEEKCLRCHNPNLAKGDLNMATMADIRKSGSDLLIAGNHQDSLIHQVSISLEGEAPEMPKDGEPLTTAEAHLLAQWIDAGASWPEDLVLKEASKADKSWWAYQPLEKTDPSEFGAENPIDTHIDRELAKKGLKRNSPADSRTLIRRATYDLIGLPPTPEEVRAFEANFGLNPHSAFTNLVDRLLASPRYGERWGRHWLDVVRFGESNGFERNVIISNLWPFRDYVIKSVNDDKPFDQLVREHIAGDVFGKDQPEVEIGTAFLVAGPYDDVGNQDAAQKAQIRANTLDEIISATGQAFLGMTIGCARCHDHKFDPITTEDYYSLYATFAGIRHGSRDLTTAEARAQRNSKLKPLNSRKADLEKTLAEIDQAILARAKQNLARYEEQWTRPKVDRTGTEELFAPVTAKFLRFQCDAQDSKPESKSFRLDEFEIWSTGKEPKNVALASNGGKASGPARKIEDFPGAYDAELVIDGKAGARFISASNHLTIELIRPTEINRVQFSSARGETIPEHRKFIFVADYRIEVSNDGENWQEVANGQDRKPANSNHLNHRLRQAEISDAEAMRLAETKRELGKVAAEIRKIPKPESIWVGTRNAADAQGPFHVFLGGSPQKMGEQVVPASLSTLSEVAPSYQLTTEAEETERRHQLAKWITSPQNPLTARVLANRLWHYHFGTGIVDTPNDFGYMGGRPTHPELLDFLATQLQEHGWRLKAIHRLIMTSKTYRQSSDWSAPAAKLDGDSRLLWRFPPRRLSAEEIRDTVLSVSGKLDLKMGGPGFRLYHFMQDNVCTYAPLDQHGPETYRRAVYHQNARASVVDLMTDFDQPDCAFSSPRRAETTTPLQALTMLNHQFTLDMAMELAKRAGGHSEPKTQVTRAFQLAYQRAPTAEELRQSLRAIDEIGLRGFCRALLNSSELIYLD